MTYGFRSIGSLRITGEIDPESQEVTALHINNSTFSTSIYKIKPILELISKIKLNFDMSILIF